MTLTGLLLTGPSGGLTPTVSFAGVAGAVTASTPTSVTVTTPDLSIGASTQLVDVALTVNGNTSTVLLGFEYRRPVLTVTAANASRIHGTANPAFGVSFAGLVAPDSDPLAVVSGTVAYATAATPTSSPNGYAIEPSGLTSADYAIVYVNGLLTVTQAPPTINWSTPAPIAYTTGGAALPASALNATISDVNLGLALTDPTTGTIAYTPASGTLLNAGSHALTVTYTPLIDSAYDDNCLQTSGTVYQIVTAIPVTITWANPADITYGTALDASQLNATSGGVPGSFIYTPASGIRLSAGDAQTLSTTFTPSDPNYATTTTTATIDVLAKALTITADDAAKVYGAANPDFAASYDGFVTGDDEDDLGGSLAFATSADASSAVGDYDVTPSGLTSTNYVIAFADGTLSITAKALTITADDAAKVYGAANPDFAASYDGFVTGDDEDDLGGSLAFATSADASSAVGDYDVTPSGSTSTNYAITFADGTLSITAKALTITTVNSTKVYGEANPDFAASYDGFVTGDDEDDLGGSLAFATSADASSAIGDYAVTPSGLTSTNYAITFADGTLTVGARTLTVTTNACSKVYGAANSDFAVSYTGFAIGDDVSDLGGLLAFTTTATAASAVGAYDVTPGGLTSTTYAITFVKGTLTVTKQELVVTADHKLVAKGATIIPASLTWTATGFVAGDGAGSAFSGAPELGTSADAATVGSYPITIAIGTLASTNYSFSLVGGTLDVYVLDVTSITVSGTITGSSATTATISSGTITKTGSTWSAAVPLPGATSRTVTVQAHDRGKHSTLLPITIDEGDVPVPKPSSSLPPVPLMPAAKG